MKSELLVGAPIIEVTSIRFARAAIGRHVFLACSSKWWSVQSPALFGRVVTQARAVQTLVPASPCFSGTQLEGWAWYPVPLHSSPLGLPAVRDGCTPNVLFGMLFWHPRDAAGGWAKGGAALCSRV